MVRQPSTGYAGLRSRERQWRLHQAYAMRLGSEVSVRPGSTAERRRRGRQAPSRRGPVETLNRHALGANLLLTCEHASNDLPAGWSWPDEDRWLRETHWAWDPGAATLTRELAAKLGVPAVLSRFSRLLVDPNRSIDSATLCPVSVEGQGVRLNAGMTEVELAQRIAECYWPYHGTLRDFERRTEGLLLSIHSFTPVMNGEERKVEVGVLHNGCASLAARWEGLFRRAGFVARVNEPYSAEDGFMFAAETHARAGARPAILLEVRNDQLLSDEARRRVRAVVMEGVGFVPGVVAAGDCSYQ